MTATGVAGTAARRIVNLRTDFAALVSGLCELTPCFHVSFSSAKNVIFLLQGQPSLCYRFENDGVCENFELPLNSVDCNHRMPPKGFTDQWALTVRTNESDNTLPHIAGEPRIKVRAHKNF